MNRKSELKRFTIYISTSNSQEFFKENRSIREYIHSSFKVSGKSDLRDIAQVRCQQRAQSSVDQSVDESYRNDYLLRFDNQVHIASQPIFWKKPFAINFIMWGHYIFFTNGVNDTHDYAISIKVRFFKNRTYILVYFATIRSTAYFESLCHKKLFVIHIL